MSTFNIPGVGLFTSDATTAEAVQTLFQDLCLQMLGVTPAGPTDAAAYRQVRIDWPENGQPDWEPSFDVLFLEATLVPERYNDQTNRSVVPNDDGVSFTQTDVYVRTWEMHFEFYGPASGDRSRQVKSCLKQRFVHDTLAASHLYLIYPLATPRRMPENFRSQWWERYDFSVRMSENVTETLVLPSMASVEVLISNGAGLSSDQTVVLPPPTP